MSRVSSVVFGTVVAAIVASVSGCQVEASIKTKNRFVEQNVVKDTTAWDGNSNLQIDIRSEGVGVSAGGGVKVTADPNAQKVTATARFLAMAFAEEKASADQSIVEAKSTFTVTSSVDTSTTPPVTKVSVVCAHGGSHGSSNGGDSGCELLEITIPAGNEGHPLALTVAGGNGDMSLQLAAATISNVGANNNGSSDITAALPATKGGIISLVANQSGDIDATMPASWAADEVILQADADKISNAFTDAQLGSGAGGRGTAGTGLASLKLTSKEFAGSTGQITLH
jgi:hypothetical protein